MAGSRRRVARLGLGVLLAALSSTRPADAAPFFLGLGELEGGNVGSSATDVSADGTTVVGNSYSTASGNVFQEAFRWTGDTGMEGLGIVGPFPARAASGDGSVVVGELFVNGFTGFRWTESDLQLFGNDGARDVSADGSVVVGGAFRWTVSSGIGFLGDLPGGGSDTDANGVSADGAIVTGVALSTAGREMFRWTSASGIVGLGDLAGGAVDAEVRGMSADGSTIVGAGHDGSDGVPVRWTEATGIVALGTLAGLAAGGIAHDASIDGSVIVGNVGGVAFVWDAQHGMRDLRQLLVDEGLDLQGWRLDSASGISDDGRVIVGSGAFRGQPEAWLILIPEPGTLALLACGLGILGLRGPPRWIEAPGALR